MRNLITGRATIGTVVVALLLAGITAVVSASAAGPSETPFPTYTAPTGLEMSSSAVANLALRTARESGEQGEVTIELARGTRTQARTVMEGGSIAAARTRQQQLESGTPSSTFCFGGQNAPCTAAEQEHAKEVLAAEGRASTYLIAMSGKSFNPSERLPRGAKPVTGNEVVLLIDGHSGLRVGMTIGAGTVTPALSELQGRSRFVAAATSTTAQAASLGKPPSHPKVRFGTVSGTSANSGEVVVFRQRSVIARTHVSHGRFRTRVQEGAYSIAGRRASGGYCRAARIVVRPQQTTVVHVRC